MSSTRGPSFLRHPLATLGILASCAPRLHTFFPLCIFPRAGAMAGRVPWSALGVRALKRQQTDPQRRLLSLQSPSSAVTRRVQTSSHANLPRRTQSGPMQCFVRSQRSFSITPVSRHGHLDPPKPGEGYDNTL